jgi:hypothetical protein
MINTLSKKIRSYHNPHIQTKWEMGVFIATNEQNLSLTRKLLEQPYKTTHESICHIGMSGYFNFDVAYWRKSNHIIIIDYNPSQVRFLKNSIKRIVGSPNRKDFVDSMIDYMNECYEERKNIELGPNKTPFYSETIFFSINVSEDESFRKIRIMEGSLDDDLRSEVCQIMYELERPGSWLSTDLAYDYVRKLAVEDRIAIFCENFVATDVLKQLGALLKTNHIILDTLYLSNAYDWLNNREEEKLFNQSISELVEPQTLIIEADQKTEMNQYIISGRKFISRTG